MMIAMSGNQSFNRGKCKSRFGHWELVVASAQCFYMGLIPSISEFAVLPFQGPRNRDI